MSEKDKLLGFKETLVSKTKTYDKPITPNSKLCPEISKTGEKLNNDFFISNAGSLSQFQYLTSSGNTRNVKNLEGGGRKRRNYLKIKKNRTNRNEKNKRKSRKHIKGY